jgi:hypothetical protein
MLNIPTSRTRLVAATVATIGLLTASSAFAADIFPPSVIALNQKPKSNQVSITYANLPQKGTLAIHGSDPSGSRGAKVLGQAKMDAGDHRNVAIKLSTTPKAGSRLWAAVETSNGKVAKNQGQAAEQSFQVL